MARMQTRRGNGSGRSAGSVLIAERWFRQPDLAALRAVVMSMAVRSGASIDQGEALVIVANELATNAVMHGGGGGRLRLWRGLGSIVCEVVDAGPGIVSPDLAAARPRPADLAASGRGLWLVRRITEDVEIESGPGGAKVAARLALPPRRAVPIGGAHRR